MKNAITNTSADVYVWIVTRLVLARISVKDALYSARRFLYIRAFSIAETVTAILERRIVAEGWHVEMGRASEDRYERTWEDDRYG